LAWKLSISKGIGYTKSAEQAPMGWRSGVILQFVNPKTWMMALSVSTTFMGGSDSKSVIALYSAIFFVIVTPCLACWGVWRECEKIIDEDHLCKAAKPYF